MAEKKKMIGFMVSSPPFSPVMIFSEKLYKSFTMDEFEWVVLHEAGHYLMWHNLKFALVQITLGIIGFIFVYKFTLMVPSVLLIAWIFSVAYVRVVTHFEYEADYFAVMHMDNPNGMISGNIKMMETNQWSMANTFLRKFFMIAVPPEERIRMAEKESKNRSAKRRYGIK